MKRLYEIYNFGKETSGKPFTMCDKCYEDMNNKVEKREEVSRCCGAKKWMASASEGIYISMCAKCRKPFEPVVEKSECEPKGQHNFTNSNKVCDCGKIGRDGSPTPDNKEEPANSSEIRSKLADGLSPQKNTNGWEEEFFETFKIVNIGDHKCEGWNDDESLDMDTGYLLDLEEIKDFIRSLLLSQKERMIERGNDFAKQNKMAYFIPDVLKNENLSKVLPERIGAMSYNQAIDDILSAIKEDSK